MITPSASFRAKRHGCRKLRRHKSIIFGVAFYKPKKSTVISLENQDYVNVFFYCSVVVVSNILLPDRTVNELVRFMCKQLLIFVIRYFVSHITSSTNYVTKCKKISPTKHSIHRIWFRLTSFCSQTIKYVESVLGLLR